jgi:hypothetical protein
MAVFVKFLFKEKLKTYSTPVRSWERKKDVQSHTYTGEYPTNRVYEFEIALLMGQKNVNFLRQAETLRTRFPDTFS